jgi:hypothetical protein
MSYWIWLAMVAAFATLLAVCTVAAMREAVKPVSPSQD